MHDAGEPNQKMTALHENDVSVAICNTFPLLCPQSQEGGKIIGHTSTVVINKNLACMCVIVMLR